MKLLIESNYKSIVDRGLISSDTTMLDFIDKLNEEYDEFFESYFHLEGSQPEELADIILVCLNIAKHFDWDIETELKNKVEINHRRAKIQNT